MRWSVLINLIAIILVVGAFTSIPLFVGPDLPQQRLWIIQLLATGFVIGWVFMLARPTPPQAEGRVAWPFSSPFVVWGGIVLLGGGFWLWMPYADEGVMLACVVCLICTVTLYIMTTIEPPPSRGRLPLAPLVLPTVIVAYLVAHPGRFTLSLGVFVACYALTIMVMQRYVQRLVDEAYAARRAAEAALIQVAAERDAKTRFLASASHDLGQPLQAARLSFDQALRSPDADLRARAVKRVGWAFDTTEQLLRQMLDHLKLDAGAVAPKLAPVPLGPLIARVGEMNEPAARLAGVDLRVTPSRLVACADAELLERTLGNLVVNALRHARARRVLVGARRRGGRVQVWVIDDGVGIPTADVPRLFEEYVQGSDHGDAIRGGFGLGLASAKRMVGLMGGEIALEASWRNGSAFRVELPAGDAKAG